MPKGGVQTGPANRFGTVVGSWKILVAMNHNYWQSSKY